MLVFTPEAEPDVEDACRWYRPRGFRLGNAFPQHDRPRHSSAGEPRMRRPEGARPVALPAGATSGRAGGRGDPGGSGAG